MELERDRLPAQKKKERRNQTAPNAPTKGLSRTEPDPTLPCGSVAQAPLLLIKSPKAQFGRSLESSNLAHTRLSQIVLMAGAQARPFQFSLWFKLGAGKPASKT